MKNNFKILCLSELILLIAVEISLTFSAESSSVNLIKYYFLMTFLFLPELIATSFFVNAYFKTEKIHRKILMILWILMLFAIPLVIFSGCEFVGKGVAAFLISIFVPSLFILSGIYFAIFHRVWQGILIGLLSFASIIQTLIFLQG